jgi:hypothetical protein
LSKCPDDKEFKLILEEAKIKEQLDAQINQRDEAIKNYRDQLEIDSVTTLSFAPLQFKVQESIVRATNAKQSKIEGLMNKKFSLMRVAKESSEKVALLTGKQEKDLYNKYKNHFNTVQIKQGFDDNQLDVFITPTFGKPHIVHVDKDMKMLAEITQSKEALMRANNELKELENDIVNLNAKPIAHFIEPPHITFNDRERYVPIDKWNITTLKTEVNKTMKSYKKILSTIQKYRNNTNKLQQATKLIKNDKTIDEQLKKIEELTLKKEQQQQQIQDIKRNKHKILNNMRNNVKERLKKKQNRIDEKYAQLDQKYNKFTKDKEEFYQKKNLIYDHMKDTDRRVNEMKELVKFRRLDNRDQINGIINLAEEYMKHSDYQAFKRAVEKFRRDDGM